MTDAAPDTPEQWLELCDSTDLTDGGLAVGFDVLYQSQACRAFAIRFEGQARAYLNRCTHVAMEMDWVPDRFFSSDRKWLLCATHGAAHHPLTGACVDGPCSGGLTAVKLLEHSGKVYWRSQYDVRPVVF